jgi:hypothetical protein
MSELNPPSSDRPQTDRRCLKASFRNPGRQPDLSPAMEYVAMLNKQTKPASSQLGPLVCLRVARAAAIVLSAIGFALCGGTAFAAEINDPPRWTKGSDFSSMKDWNLKAEQIVPHGVNPLYSKIALQRTPGKVTDVTIERKRGKECLRGRDPNGWRRGRRLRRSRTGEVVGTD